MTPAQEILKQLGGNKFIAMTGASIFSDNNGNTLVTKFKGSKIANIMYITYNSLDLYNVKICKYRKLEVKTVKEVENVYCDMLQSIFTRTTGLNITL